ncbi:hypothetical protein LPJ78_004228 [Coemansia sp. RSA 989]|nr:hypothetical protein BX667DRAFT_103448 [Coemansia mojavensis]KAJ1863155.1 hypothetical protein LPJ78_004228 [Coemansia sp. RSA 989]KAJ2646727.1 hypothetical protein IWW40_005211 [Coemansia sp. RSA 1250]KAJ2668524.1 hypothetical protein IWW42_005142 [Coemansia sp. RSA 1085]
MDHGSRPYEIAPGMGPPHPHPFGAMPARHAPMMPQRPMGQMELKPNFYNPYHVKHRRRTTKEQLALLEGTFKTTPKPSSEVRKALASKLCMTAREVQIWFQNRRAKQKNMMLRASTAARSGESASSTPPAPAVGASSAGSLAAPPAHPMAAAEAAVTKHARAASADRPAARDAGPRRHSDIASLGLGGAPTAQAGSNAAPGWAEPSRLKKRDTGRFHTARVHQEAFDGTNKLPVKPDDLTPTADEQFSMLDPTNLPTFMMPTQPSMPPLGTGLWMPYGAAPQPPSNLPAAPQTDALALYNSLLGIATPAPPLPGFGAPGSGALPAGNLQLPEDFYQSLQLLLSQQSTAAPKDSAALFMPAAAAAAAPLPQALPRSSEPSLNADLFAASAGGNTVL